jgi:hypothetical protein
MARRPEVAVLEGRTALAERGASLFDRVSAAARAVQPGEIQAAGPNSLFRAESFEQVGGFRADIDADATADLCIRLRRRGAHIWRTDAPMAVIEPRQLTLKSWRQDSARRGFAFAAGAALHGAPPERYNSQEQARAFFWGGFVPALAVLTAIVLALASGALGGNAVVGVVAVIVGVVTIYGLKIAATALRADAPGVPAWAYGFFTTLGHFSEFSGVMKYWFGGPASAGARGKAAR